MSKFCFFTDYSIYSEYSFSPNIRFLPNIQNFIFFRKKNDFAFLLIIQFIPNIRFHRIIGFNRLFGRIFGKNRLLTLKLISEKTTDFTECSSEYSVLTEYSKFYFFQKKNTILPIQNSKFNFNSHYIPV
jgi:hypothetical protein